MSSALGISVAVNLEDLLSVESQWQELWQASPRGTPFQSPDWLIPFVRVFSPAEIRVLLIWRKDQLVGLFPFWIERGFGPSTIKSNLESVFRQTEKSGRSLDFEIANDDSFEEGTTLLYHLHTKRWQRRGSAGIFATEQQRHFYRQAFKSLHAAGAAKLFVLHLDGNPVAALVAFLHKRVLYYYIGAFDPDYAKLGPGNLIILRAIEFAGRAGCHSFDFLRGRESYKYRWGARDQPTVVRKLCRS